MDCKICDTHSRKFAKAVVLQKYEIDYFKCPYCGFVQTESPYWLNEAYQDPIAKSDYGLIARNLLFSQLTTGVIINGLNPNGKFLDYGSGYGFFIQLMQYLGFHFQGYDTYCKSIFAPHAVIHELEGEYDLITAFEVFEHFVDPITDIERLLQHSRTILFSTELITSPPPSPQDWHYYVLDEGQHISLYTEKSLQYIAQKFNLNLYTNHHSIHLLTEYNLRNDLTDILQWERYQPSQVFPQLHQILLRDVPRISLILNSTNFFASQTSIRDQNIPFTIIIDGMFFQRYNTGIARVWRSLLNQWANTEFAQYLVIIDRGKTAPRFSGLTYRDLPLHSYANPDFERQQLQNICDQENATLFISTYYTLPITTPSVFMAYDMIPEVLGADFNDPMWQEKHRAIQHAQAYIGISQNTLDDLVRCFPDAATKPRTVAHCGVEPIFTPASTSEIERFKQKYGIHKPYFILCAPGTGYKNAQLFFRAFAQLPTRLGFELVCTGNMGWLDDNLRALVPGTTIHTLYLEDAELRLAFSGAIALVYPSRYEGFGLPVLEALACGCPIVTTPTSSLPEVAGEAAIYINPDDEAAMIAALCEVQNPRVRQSLRLTGLQQVQQFSWATMAHTVERALIMASLPVTNLREINYLLAPDWSQSEEVLNEALSTVLKMLADQKSPITLLFYAADANAEDVNTLLAGIAFNLMMMESIDLDEHLAIAILPPLHPVQWSALLPEIHGRIPLNCDDAQVVTLPPLQVLPVIQISS